MKNSHVIPKTDTKDSRQTAKMKRKKGLKYLESKGITPVAHSQANDPLFKIKGIQRHRKLKFNSTFLFKTK